MGLKSALGNKICYCNKLCVIYKLIMEMPFSTLTTEIKIITKKKLHVSIKTCQVFKMESTGGSYSDIYNSI